MKAASLAVFLERQLSRLAEVGSAEYEGLTKLIGELKAHGETEAAHLKVVRVRARRATPDVTPQREHNLTPSKNVEQFAAAFRATRGDVARGRDLVFQADRSLKASEVKQLLLALHLGSVSTKAKGIAALKSWVTTEGQIKELITRDIMAE